VRARGASAGREVRDAGAEGAGAMPDLKVRSTSARIAAGQGPRGIPM